MEQRYLVEILNDGKKNGEFEFASATPVASMMQHAFYGLRQWLLHHSNHTTIEEERILTQESNLFIEIFLTGLKPRTAYKRISTNGKKNTIKNTY
jgi:hypothetical protein